jgi:hypothetical protein
VLFPDESGGDLQRGTIRNRLHRLMELEGRPTTEWFSRMHFAGRARPTTMNVASILLLFNNFSVGR